MGSKIHLLQRKENKLKEVIHNSYNFSTVYLINLGLRIKSIPGQIYRLNYISLRAMFCIINVLENSS